MGMVMVHGDGDGVVRSDDDGARKWFGFPLQVLFRLSASLRPFLRVNDQ